MQVRIKPELLAPAGTLDAVKVVLDAGADAVYLGGKSLNMRQHRSSYNLTDSEVAEAVNIAHNMDKKVYYTLNSLLTDSQLPELRKTLAALAEINPDAIIVQDLAVATLAREICVQIPLHASTMMNIHNTESAVALKMMGFTRIVTSRDIPLHEIKMIGENSGVEMEYFIHGDMCVSQSSQCYISGILFGESSNCGRCMKPCRWKWQLVGKNGESNDVNHPEGYLLARKDLCLFQHIPELITSGIASLKIEGRMRTAEFLAPIINTYRKAIDAYCDDPVNYSVKIADLQTILKSQVREYTTAMTFSKPGPHGVDTSGKREPRFFSYDAGEPVLTIPEQIETAEIKSVPELIVNVSGANSAHAAVNAGADAVYFSGDGFVRHNGSLDLQWLSDFVRDALRRNIRVAVLMPHICDRMDITQWQPYLKSLSRLKNLAIGVTNLGGIHLARKAGIRNIISDLTMNITNSVAADELSTMGVDRVTASTELNFEQISLFAQKSRMPLELIVQGPQSGMLLENCIIAATFGISSHDICPMDCRKDIYSLRDDAGNEFPVEPDKRCRNHIFTAHDVCALPNLARILSLNVAGLRIEAQLDKPSTVEAVTGVYRGAVDSLKSGNEFDITNGLETIKAATNRPVSDGPFDFENIPESIEETKFV